MKKYAYFLTFLLSVINFCVTADPIICFFFKPMADAQQIAHKLKQPGKIAQHTIHSIIDHIPVSGIYVTYAGFITVSDENGEVQLPRKHREDMVNILITTDIEPVPQFENTIRQWNLAPHTLAQMYTLQEKYNASTKESTWEIHKSTMPADNQIPLTTIIIIAKPKNIFIPLEPSKTIKSANLMLPAIYVKKGINSVSQGMYTLTVRHLFRPITQKAQQTPLRLTTHLLN